MIQSVLKDFTLDLSFKFKLIIFRNNKMFFILQGFVDTFLVLNVLCSAKVHLFYTCVGFSIAPKMPKDGLWLGIFFDFSTDIPAKVET